MAQSKSEVERAAQKNQPLVDDVRMLGRILGDVIREQEGKAAYERVERIRRIQLNDLESLPFFLVAGLLFVLTEPSVMLTRLLLYGYVLSRLLHFGAYFTARTHDTRATLWTVGSLILIFMTCWSLVFAVMQA